MPLYKGEGERGERNIASKSARSRPPRTQSGAYACLPCGHEKPQVAQHESPVLPSRRNNESSHITRVLPQLSVARISPLGRSAEQAYTANPSTSKASRCAAS
mmetsp:Transcript_3239/g.5975  ORF Transcript_3239/g.5975 Transcript_3239/m.5975 type:complete len:102 (+) Transcript_3239:403-708(+)